MKKKVKPRVFNEKRIEDAICALGEAFPWHESKEGVAYWDEVVRNLDAMIGSKRCRVVPQRKRMRHE